MSYSFGKVSMKQYETLHNDLQLILDHSILECAVDFSLIKGHRPPEKQFEYFRRGRVQQADGSWVVVRPQSVITNVDGYRVKGTHNYNPSLAIDIAAYVTGKRELAYDLAHLAYIAGCIMTIANRLFKEGKVKHKLRWGGNWDGDGDLADNILFDAPHFELFKP